MELSIEKTIYITAGLVYYLERNQDLEKAAELYINENNINLVK